MPGQPSDSNCPFCREEVKAEAILCKHCHSPLHHDRRAIVMSGVLSRMEIVTAEINRSLQVQLPPVNVSSCKVLCHHKFSEDKAALRECLGSCDADSMVAVIAERLQRELVLTFAELIWGGGDIDPVPFEQKVRDHFSQPKPRP